MIALELTSVISPDITKDTYKNMEKIFDIIFKGKRNKSVIIRFDNVIKNIQIGVLKGPGYSFSQIYNIDDTNKLSKNIPVELHNSIISLYNLIDTIFNICFSSRKKVVYFGLYKYEHQLILNTRSNVKINPMFIYDKLLHE